MRPSNTGKPIANLTPLMVVCVLIDSNDVELRTVCYQIRVGVVMNLSEHLTGVVEKKQALAERMELAA